MARLDSVITALEQGEVGRALEALLAQWAVAPGPELLELTREVARHARGTVDPLAATGQRNAHRAWLEVAEQARSSDLVWLLDAFLVEPFGLYRGARRGQSLAKLEALLRFQPDPRLAELAEQQLASHLSDSAEVAGSLGRLLVAARGATVRTRLEEAALRSRAHARALQPVLTDDLTDRRAVTVPAATIARARALVNGLAQAAPASTLGSLWAAVWAAPFDDAPRRVLADALIEAQDPRGEYLALQFNPKKQTAANRLLERIRGGWLAPWRDFVAVDLVEFERGLPSKAMFIDSPRVDDGMRTLTAVVVASPSAEFLARPELSNVRHVEGAASLLGEALKAVSASAPLHWASIRAASGSDASTAALLHELSLGKVKKVSSLTVDGFGPAGVAAAQNVFEQNREGVFDFDVLDAEACGAVVSAASGAGVTLTFSCRPASLKGLVRAGSLTLRVASTSPSAAQRTFATALRASFESLECRVEGAQWPAALRPLADRAQTVVLGEP